ncbi:MAG: signal peptide peptidase SppA [Opitutaceae bacterium]
MKNFFTSLLGALVALIIFSFGGALLFIGFVGAMAALGGGDKATPTFESGSYVVFDLAGNITDAPRSFDLSSLTGAEDGTLQLRTITRALRAAAKDSRVAGIFIKGELSPAGYGTGYAALKEVRAALTEFKASGKPVKAFLTTATTKDYYLASAASEIAIDHYGMIIMPGLASQPTFYAGAFEKYGVGVQVTRVGKYKSAVEPFTRRDMSVENREQIQKLLNDVWGGLVSDIAADRGITAANLQTSVDQHGIIRAEQAIAGKLVDRVVYRDEVIEELKASTGRAGSKKPFKQITLSAYARVANDVVDTPKKGAGDTVTAKSGGRGRIAIVYAEGEIVDGEGELGEIGGTKFSREIRALRQDENVKAIVLRVNSPGGSATASETIQREIVLAQRAKPVVVSMGSYAASGGYWISTYSDRIFAEPTTITGSIGVFGVQFDVQKLANGFGLTFDSVKTGKFADALTITRPKTAEEMAVFQDMVDWIYGEFVRKVAESRQLKRERVEEIAQGRVWSGIAAKELGLVDEIGGLDAALGYAAQKAGLGTNYRIIEYPRKKDLAEAIQDLFDKAMPGSASSGTRSGTLASKLVQRVEADLKMFKAFNDPQGLYARLPIDLAIH